MHDVFKFHYPCCNKFQNNENTIIQARGELGNLRQNIADVFSNPNYHTQNLHARFA